MQLNVRLDNGVPVLDSIDRYADAIASIESAGSGGYAAVGPATGTGDRAYGKYQVMGKNVPAWTKEVFGYSMTPKEFLSSPEAQETVFRHKFGQYVAQYGNPQDAASMWFSGRPLGQAKGRKDVLGTTASGYVSRFNKALGQPSLAGSAPNPTQFGLPVIPTGEVIDMQARSRGINDILGPESGGARLAGRGGAKSFGSQWRTQEGVGKYEAESGLRPGTLKPVEKPGAEVLPFNAPPSAAANHPLQMRIKAALQEQPELRNVIGKWVDAYTGADPKIQQAVMNSMSNWLSGMGY